jgi:hypothetical protein
VGSGLFEAASCVAVLAAENAGVVHSDVTADDAPAVITLCRIFAVSCLNPKNLLQQVIVDAFSGTNAVRAQVNRLGAAHDVHAIRSG